MNAVPSNPNPPRFSRLIHPVSLAFPKSWLGFLLAALTLFLELTSGVFGALPDPGEVYSVAKFVFAGLALVVYFAGLAYWFWGIYRVHKILAEATSSQHPITPKKAVFYQFIPFYNIYWNFKWPNRIADFVRQNSQFKMRKGWAGLALLSASILGTFDKGLELVLLFVITAYLSHKIKRVLPYSAKVFSGAPLAPATLAYLTSQRISSAPRAESPAAVAAAVAAEAWDLRMAKEWKLPVNSGIGAAFGFLMCYGFWNLLDKIQEKGDMWGGLTGQAFQILLVAIVLYFFLEPLADKVLETFKVSESHHDAAKNFWKRAFRFGVFLVIIDVAHSLLERAAEGASEEVGGLGVAGLGILLTLFFGGMTYLWICGAPKRRREALVLVGPGTAVILIFGLMVLSAAGPLGKDLGKARETTENIVLNPSAANLEGHLKNFDLNHSSAQDAGEELVETFPGNKARGVNLAILLALAIFVSLAGFAAMRKKLGPVGVAGTVFFASLLSGLILLLTLNADAAQEKRSIIIALWSAFWWCLGMLAFYDHEIFPRSQFSRRQHTSAPQDDQAPPRLVWLASGLVLAGLIGAAYLTQPPAFTLTADNQVRAYGQPNPPLTYTPSGPQSGLVGEPSLCSSAILDSPPGTYPITLGPGTTKSEKYKLRFVNGSLIVKPAETQTAVLSPATAASAPLTLTAVVAPARSHGVPTGKVTFYAGAIPVGDRPLSDGTASYNFSGLPVGAHLITAQYSGDANFNPSTSTWTQQIAPPEITPQVFTPPPHHSNVIPAGTHIYIATMQPIDSSTTNPYQPLTAILAAPLEVNGQSLGKKGATAILGLTDIDSDGRVNGKPSLTVKLMKLQIADQIYPLDLIIQMQGKAAGPAGRIYLPAATILTFKVRSPVPLDTPQ